jgi:hypothetical protein
VTLQTAWLRMIIMPVFKSLRGYSDRFSRKSARAGAEKPRHLPAQILPDEPGAIGERTQGPE